MFRRLIDVALAQIEGRGCRRFELEKTASEREQGSHRNIAFQRYTIAIGRCYIAIRCYMYLYIIVFSRAVWIVE